MKSGSASPRWIGATLLVLLSAVSAPADAQSANPRRAPLQALVSLTADWDSIGAVVQRFERRAVGEPWRAVGTPMAATVGRGGLGWGRGLYVPSAADGPRKQEGDGRAPAGIFALGPAFGYAPADSVRWIRLPYVHSLASVQCVDDPASRAYNRLVDRDTVRAPDWNSHEEMRLPNQVYRLGVWVSHNDAPPQPGAGSCIFLHIQRGTGVPTVGCTAFAAADLEEILRWLDPRAAPVLVQAPRAAYGSMALALALPSQP
jgi:L,D-peptidoglycan transpeptidase YkuD (ErfK/YbiS/YcfS/YnhG family)